MDPVLESLLKAKEYGKAKEYLLHNGYYEIQEQKFYVIRGSLLIDMIEYIRENITGIELKENHKTNVFMQLPEVKGENVENKS